QLRDLVRRSHWEATLEKYAPLLLELPGRLDEVLTLAAEGRPPARPDPRERRGGAGRGGGLGPPLPAPGGPRRRGARRRRLGGPRPRRRHVRPACGGALAGRAGLRTGRAAPGSEGYLAARAVWGDERRRRGE